MFFRLLNYLNSKNFFPYYICTPLIYSIGNASEHIYTSAAHAKRVGKKILIFKTRFLKKFLNYDICNNELFDSLILNEQKKINNFSYKLIDFFIQIEFVVRRSLAIFFKKFFRIEIGEEFRFPMIGSTDLYRSKKIVQYNKISPLSIKACTADIEAEKKNECMKLLNKNGINSKKFVCLHVRDNNYYKDAGRREYRNSEINNYIELIKFLISKDYYVIRLGDKPAPKVKYENKNFIDLPYTNLKSEIMDLYLIKECQFYVGTLSGTMDTAYLFKKPLFLTNMYDLFPSFPRKIYDRAIFKTIVNKQNGKEINLHHFAELGIKYHHCETDIKDLIFKENTSDELLEGINEYYELINTSDLLNVEKIRLSKIQKEFNSYLKERLEKIYYQDFITKNFFKKDAWKENEFKRIVKRFKACDGTYNTSYLEKKF